jgi:D-alanyl-D-alanine carboxypeptidase (penicillin-binding protein 5/6)
MKLWVLCLLLFFSQLYAEPLKLDVSAESAVLMNADTGCLLFEKNAHRPAYPASITKIATALYALEVKGSELDELVIATREALWAVPPHIKRTAQHPPHRLESDGSMMGLRPGEAHTLRTLLHGMMLASGNDAANVVAEHISGTVEAFMHELNCFLCARGLQRTTFRNPHGLHHPEHQTTAYDMALLTKEAMRHAYFKEIVKTVRYMRPETAYQPAAPLVQTNRLLRPGQQEYYAKAVGVKTGYTAAAGKTLVAAAEHEGRTLIAVLLGCKESGERFRDAVALFEAAFAEKKVERTLFTREYDPFTVQLEGGDRPLRALLGEDLTVSYYPAEEPEMHAVLVWGDLQLPVRAGACVGAVELRTYDNTLLKSAPLYAAHPVSMTLSHRALTVIRREKASLMAACIGIVLVGTAFLARKR